MSEWGGTSNGDEESRYEGSLGGSSPRSPSSKKSKKGKQPISVADELGIDVEGLGDVTDVPREHFREVVEFLRSLPGPEDYPGGIDELRTWILALRRLAGFSNEATMQIFSSAARLLEVPRVKTKATSGSMPSKEQSREQLQQAFLRMQGVQETVNIMLMRLSDPGVVAAACHLLSASVQGSPLTAEYILQEKPGNIRLLMRAIERHSLDPSVAEHGCVLIAHLCSQPPVATFSAAPSRATAHRECQSFLAGTGAIDLVMNILASSLETVKKEDDKLQRAVAKQAQYNANPSAEDEDANSEALAAINRAKAAQDLKKGWQTLDDVEVVGAFVQDAALQALLLLAFDNPDTTRLLAGELWVFGSVRQAEIEKARLAEIARKEAAAKPKPAAKKKGRFDKPKKEAPPPPPRPPTPTEDEFGLPLDREKKCALTTLDAFVTTCTLLIDVLTGRVSRDRPALAAKACRLITLLAERGAKLLQQIEADRIPWSNNIEMYLRPREAPGDNRKPPAPFLPLVDLLSALFLGVRTHKEDPTFLATALSLLMKMKSYSLLSAPAGADGRGEGMLLAWQRALGEAEETDELADSITFLKRVVERTDLIQATLKSYGGTLDQVSGDDVVLTPRCREFVSVTMAEAQELAGDCIAAKWRNGEPTRKERKHGKVDELQKSPATKGRGKGRGGARAKSTPAKKKTDDSEPPPEAPTKKILSPEEIEKLQRKEAKAKREKQLDEADWKRPIGYDAHDEEDFKRMWQPALLDALQSSMQMPAIKAERQKLKDSAAVVTETVRGEFGRSDSAPMLQAAFAEKEAFDIRFVSSEPGILRTQVVLPSLDGHHQRVSEMRQRALQDPNLQRLLHEPVSKHMKKRGYLLPEYGIQVVFKKGLRRDLAGSEKEKANAAIAASLPAGAFKDTFKRR